MQNHLKSIAEYLKKYRKIYKLTQEQFAQKLEMSKKAIEKWEQGKSEVPFEILLMLKNGLNLTFDELYGLSQSNTSHLEVESPELWKIEYEKDDSITYEYESEYLTTSTEYLKHIQLKEMRFFLDGSNLPLYLDGNEIVLVTEPSIEKNIICFFLRKGFLSYKKTIDYVSKTANFRILVAPVLAKALINLHIDYLSEMIKTPEQIEEIVRICIRKEKARKDCAFQNESTIKQIAELKGLILKIEKLETV